MKTLAIDQSLKATGLCMLDTMHESPEPPVLETVHCDDVTGFARVDRTVSRVNALIDEHLPELLVVEGYDYGSGTNNLCQVAELLGAIKYHAQSQHGYKLGYGTSHNKEERDASRTAMKKGGRLLVAQASGTMKKFCLNEGGKGKDTAYLLHIFQRLGVQFVDDNQADAYMHAWMAGQVLAVLQGRVPISHLAPHQQESLITAVVGRKNLPKGMSLNKAMKLPDEAKLELIKL